MADSNKDNRSLAIGLTVLVVALIGLGVQLSKSPPLPVATLSFAFWMFLVWLAVLTVWVAFLLFRKPK